MAEALHIVFDGPPAPNGPRFIEVETPDGRSINAGQWRERADGYWELVIGGPSMSSAAHAVEQEAIRAIAGLRDPRMALAEADPLTAVNYALDSFDAYGDPGDALTFLRMWREGDLSESQQYRDYVVAGGFSA